MLCSGFEPLNYCEHAAATVAEFPWPSKVDHVALFAYDLPIMHVLVTGGAGFIGSHLVNALVTRGDRVTVLDNASTGRWENLSFSPSDTRVVRLTHDVTEPYDLDVDTIINLACPASPVQYQRDPVKTIRTNIQGMIHALELAHRRNIPVVQASTSEVYGDPAVHPQPETYWGHVNPIGPRACYDEGKRAAETLCADYRRQYGVHTKIVRIFNTYGPRMAFDDGRVVSNFILQALSNKPLTIAGDGTQTRSFCYVTDLVSGLLRMLDAPADISGPINLGNPEEYSVFELAQHILQLTGSRSPFVHIPLPQDDPRQRRPNIERAMKELDWKPTTSVRDGLTQTIADFRSRLTV